MMTDAQRDDSPKQPEYGQFKQPEYGALAGQYPGYDPYLYGKPDADGSNETDAPMQRNGVEAQAAPAGQAAQAGQPAAYPFGDGASQSPNGLPRQLKPINLDDPNENPLYGRWDPYAIVAFVGAVVFTLPLFPALIGGAAIWRTRIFHMKGRGLAIAAVVINVLTTAMQIWMWMNGVSLVDLYSQLYSSLYGGGSGGTSGDSGTVSA